MDYRVNGRLVRRGEKLMVIVPVEEEVGFKEYVDDVDTVIINSLLVKEVVKKRGWVKGRKRKV